MDKTMVWPSFLFGLHTVFENKKIEAKAPLCASCWRCTLTAQMAEEANAKRSQLLSFMYGSHLG